MSERFWTLLSRIDARLIFALVLVAIAALVAGPLLDSERMRGTEEAEALPVEAPDRPSDPPRLPPPPAPPEEDPFDSPFVARAVAEGLPPPVEPDPLLTAEDPLLPPDPPPAEEPPIPAEPEPPAEPAVEPAEDPAPEPAAPVWVLLYRGHMVRPDGRILGLIERSDARRGRFYGIGESLGPFLVENIDLNALTLQHDDARHVLQRGIPLELPDQVP